MNIPNGFKLVPAEPTDAMHDAARDWSIRRYGKAIGSDASRGCYSVMLTAAPTPPQPIFDEAAERELFNTWYAKNVGVLGTSTWAEYIGVWMACAQSRAKAGEDE